MNISCDCIMDLLPLYHDGVCSEASKKLIEAHLEECAACKGMLDKMKDTTVDKQLEHERIDVVERHAKKVKKRILFRGIGIAVIAVAVTFSIFWYAVYHNTPIAYSEGIVRVEETTIEKYLDNGSTTPVLELQIAITKNYSRTFHENRLITVNGVETEILYLCCTETLSTKLRPTQDGIFSYQKFSGLDKESFGFDYVDSPPIPLEIYYITVSKISNLEKISSMSDEDFYTQRMNGVLLWSGILE